MSCQIESWDVLLMDFPNIDHQKFFLVVHADGSGLKGFFISSERRMFYERRPELHVCECPISHLTLGHEFLSHKSFLNVGDKLRDGYWSDFYEDCIVGNIHPSQRERILDHIKRCPTLRDDQRDLATENLVNGFTLEV